MGNFLCESAASWIQSLSLSLFFLLLRLLPTSTQIYTPFYFTYSHKTLMIRVLFVFWTVVIAGVARIFFFFCWSMKIMILRNSKNLCKMVKYWCGSSGWLSTRLCYVTRPIAISRVLRAFSNGRTDGPVHAPKKVLKRKTRWKATSLFVQTCFLIWQLGTYERGDFNGGAKKMLLKWAKIVNPIAFWRVFGYQKLYQKNFKV